MKPPTPWSGDTMFCWLLPTSWFHFSILCGDSSFSSLQVGVIYSGLGPALAHLLLVISLFCSAWFHSHTDVSQSTVLFGNWLAPLTMVAREYFTAIQVYSCLKQSSCFHLTPHPVPSPAHFFSLQSITIPLSIWPNILESFLIVLFSWFPHLISHRVFLGSTN